MQISHASIVTAFSEKCVGSKVTDKVTFSKVLAEAVQGFTFPENGQGFIPLSCLDTVSCGTASRTGLREEDYVVRCWRGEMGLFARRQHAADTENLAAIIYTAKAYCEDAQVSQEEITRIQSEGATHVLVAVLASAGPRPPVSSVRFVRNLAGGNKRYWPEEGYTIDEAIMEAKKVAAYEAEWATVAD